MTIAARPQRQTQRAKTAYQPERDSTDGRCRIREEK
jgi:hypothetical protein